MTKLLDRKQAADALEISVATLDRLRRSGQLAYLQRIPNSKVWITSDAIAEYLARITRPAIPERQTINTYRKRRKK